MNVQFYEEARDADLKFAVIAARYGDKWLFCRQTGKTTWELPGGHREAGETIFETARRELWEETGATGFQLEPVSAYSYLHEGETSFGALFFAEIWELGERPAAFEMEETSPFDAMPPEMSWPTIQPHLFAKVEAWLSEGGYRSQMDDMFEMML